MSSWHDFFYGDDRPNRHNLFQVDKPLYPLQYNNINTPVPTAIPSKPTRNKKKTIVEEKSEDEIDLKYIIRNEPKTSIVRQWAKSETNKMKSEEELLFDISSE